MFFVAAYIVNEVVHLKIALYKEIVMVGIGSLLAANHT